jgi:FMN-dependent NADH-azoreductase
MKKLLHIIATPRGEDSRTLKVTATFLEEFTKTHPDWVIDGLNLFKEDLPELTVKRVDGKYILLSGKDLFGELKEAWEEIVAHIERFRPVQLEISGQFKLNITFLKPLFILFIYF